MSSHNPIPSSAIRSSVSIANYGTTRLGSGVTPIALPENAFRTFGLANDETAGSNYIAVNSINNLYHRASIDMVYSFAQERTSSLPMLIKDVVDMPSGSAQYKRRGDTEWTIKTRAGVKTPNAFLDYDSRIMTEVVLHQGNTQDIDLKRRMDGSVSITADFQMSLSDALARDMDKFVQRAIISPVTTIGTDVDEDYSIANQGGVDILPDSNYLVVTNGKTGSNLEIAPLGTDPTIATAKQASITGQRFLDRLGLIVESRNLVPSSMVIIGSPQLRRQLLAIDSFRNIDNTRHFQGAGEYFHTFLWNNFNFIFLKPDAYLKQAKYFHGKKFDEQGNITSAAASTTAGSSVKAIDFGLDSSFKEIPSGAGSTTAADRKALSDVESFLLVDPSGLKRGITHGNYVNTAVLFNNSFADQHYYKTSCSFSVQDFTKVYHVLYKKIVI